MVWKNLTAAEVASLTPGAKGYGKGGKTSGGKANAGGKGALGKGAELPEFQCFWDDCAAACKGQRTRQGRCNCHGCGRPRGQAVNPPLASKHPWYLQDGTAANGLDAEGFQLQSKSALRRQRQQQSQLQQQQKGQQAQAQQHGQKGKGSPGATPSQQGKGPANDAAAPAAGSQAPKKYQPTTEEERGIPPEVSLAAFGLVTMSKMLEPKTAFAWPAKPSWDKTPQQIVEGVAVCKSAAQLAAAKTSESKYEAALALNELEQDHKCAKMYQGLLVDVRTEISRLTSRRSTSGAAGVETMRSKLQDAVTDEAVRLQDNTEAAAAGQRKMDLMRLQFVNQQEELARRLQLFDSIREEYEQAWATCTAARLERHVQVKEAWEAAIAAAAVQPAALGVAAEPLLAAPAPAVPGAEDLAASAHPEAPTMEKALADYARKAPWSPDLVPDVDKPETEEYDFWMRLGHNVSDWVESHSCVMCSWAQLIGTDGDQLHKMQSVRTLVGQEYWDLLYPNQEEVTPHDAVPQIMGFILYQSMVKPCAWATEHHGVDKAKKSKETAKEAFKAKLKDLKEGKTNVSGKFVASRIHK